MDIQERREERDGIKEEKKNMTVVGAITCVSVKADLRGTTLAYNHRIQLAYNMT